MTVLQERFRREVCERAKEIDPDEQYDWFALSYGWALATGLTPDEAHAFAVEVRYTYQYWTP